MTAIDLHPTKTRVAILAAADLGNVRRSAIGDEDYRIIPGELPRNVTKHVGEMQRAEWLYLDEETSLWRPTGIGAQVLAEHEPPPSPSLRRKAS